MICNFAIKVTEENIPSIIEYMRNFNLDVSFELDDIVGYYEHHTFGGPPYAFLSIRRDPGYEDIAAFTVLCEKDFNRNWKFEGTDTGIFKPVVDREGA